jgi:hypothetical protein
MIDFSNKENIKIAVMVGLALVLIIVIAKRFSNSGTDEPVSAVAGHEQIEMHEQQNVKRQYSKAPFKKTAMKSENIKLFNSEAPPFLTRDLFNSRIRDIIPKREKEQVKEVPLELTATIIDGNGELAIIGDEVLGIGDEVKGFTIKEVRNNEVLLARDGDLYTLGVKDE